MRFFDVMNSREGRALDFSSIVKDVERLCVNRGLTLFYIFGSYATASAGKLSDVDVAVLGRQALSLDDTLAIITELQGILEDEAIDPVDLARAPGHLVHRVLRDGKCLFAETLSDRIEFEVGRESRYFDEAWLRRDYFAALERRIADGTFGG